MRALMLGLVLLVLLAGSVNAEEFYVSPTGSDSNPGTIDEPFHTIQKARAERSSRGHSVTIHYCNVLFGLFLNCDTACLLRVTGARSC